MKPVIKQLIEIFQGLDGITFTNGDVITLLQSLPESPSPVSGSDADFTLWVVVNKWEYDQANHRWYNNYITQFRDKYVSHPELYQLFNPNGKQQDKPLPGWTALFTDEKEYGEYLKWRKQQ